MRIGANPAKINPDLGDIQRHRVIIPIYIPNHTGYHEHTFEVLKMCLESLKLSAAGKVAVTLLANQSSPQVKQYLQEQQQEGWVDQLVLNSENLGKVDAVAAAARGAYEELLTITDCDVLFAPGWLEAAESTFAAFPECGFLGLSPNPKLSLYHTSACILGAAARRELQYDKVAPEIDLQRFATSIGNPTFFTEADKASQLILRRGDTTACVGGGHFAFTIRKAVSFAIPTNPSRIAVSNKSEEAWLDVPPDQIGLWRLSTPSAYAQHIGNVPETWVYELLDEYRASSNVAADDKRPANLPELRVHWSAKFPVRVRRRLARFLRNPSVARYMVQSS